MAIVVLAVVGMFGYGYYSKHKAEAALLDSLHEDSMMTVKEFNSQQESKTDTTNRSFFLFCLFTKSTTTLSGIGGGVPAGLTTSTSGR